MRVITGDAGCCPKADGNKIQGLQMTLTHIRTEASTENQTILLALYGEICSSWRMLTDVRFKLLGFVPAVSLAFFFITLLSKPDAGTGLAPLAHSLVVGLGMFITVALYIYERRNSQLYGELIQRGREIEVELGIESGLFHGRSAPTNRLICHSVAVRVIYSTAITGWFLTTAGAWRGW